MKIIILFYLFIIVFSPPSVAVEFHAGNKKYSAVRHVYDGDTFNLAFRLADLDTPEIKGKCNAERALAKKSRDFSRDYFKRSKQLKIEVVGVGFYGRPIVNVTSTQGHLNRLLKEQGLAVVYSKNRKHNWCL